MLSLMDIIRCFSHLSVWEVIIDYLSYQIEICHQVNWLINQINKIAKPVNKLHVYAVLSTLVLWLQYILYVLYLFCVVDNRFGFLCTQYVPYVHSCYFVFYDLRFLRLNADYILSPPRRWSHLVNIPWFVVIMHAIEYVDNSNIQMIMIILNSLFYVTLALKSINFYSVTSLIFFVIYSVYLSMGIGVNHGKLFGLLLALHICMFTYFSFQFQFSALRLVHAKEKSSQSLRIRSSALSFISHECRTPLHYILGTLELLKKDSVFSPKHRETISLLHVMGISLMDHLNGMLFLDRAEKKQLTFEPSLFRFKKMLNRVIDTSAALANNFNSTANVRVSNELKNLEFIVTDEHRLQQILLSILSNRIRNTTNGNMTLFVGRCIDIRSPDIPREAFCVRKPDSESVAFELPDLEFNVMTCEGLIFKIYDGGSNEDQLFIGRFLDISRNSEEAPDLRRVAASMGLGLTICMRLVEILHGGIWIRRQESKGVAFFLTIPAVIDPHIFKNSNNISKDLRLPYEKIANISVLTCDDDLIFRKVIRKQLTTLGFGMLHECMNGREAVKIFESFSTNHPSLILLDMNTKYLNGLEAAKRIREISERRGIISPYIILVSGDESLCSRFVGSCINDVLMKPFELTSLRGCIMKALN